MEYYEKALKLNTRNTNVAKKLKGLKKIDSLFYVFYLILLGFKVLTDLHLINIQVNFIAFNECGNFTHFLLNYFKVMLIFWCDK